MFDASDAPALLIQHQVVDDAADRELGILFDRIVLEVLVAAVPIGEVAPVRIPVADALAEQQAHRRAFDVERLVVLEHANRVLDIEILGGGVDLLEEQRQSGCGEKCASLLQVGALAEIQHECLEPRRRQAEAQHGVIGEQEHRSAVDAAGKGDPDRFRL